MRSYSRFLIGLCCGLLLVASEAHAGDKTETRSKRQKKKVSEVGDYDGVQSGSSSITPPGAKGRGKNRAAAFWVGFKPQEGGASRVFVQLGQSVDVKQWMVGKTLVVHLPKIRIANRTVARFLDTRFFDTAIRNIRTKATSAKRAKGDQPAHLSGLQLHIDFKNSDDAGQSSASVKTEADGYTYLYLDFGPGTEADAGATQ